MTVRKTGSFAGPIDTQINEIIRSIRELEERVMDIKNSLGPQTEETVYDLERHVFNRDNPHLVTAAQLKALPLAFVLDPSSVYITFHNTLKSTKGLKPLGYDGAIRTDYGLIYNPDGSLCATLLPEGGVTVERGATNTVGLDFESDWTYYGGAGTSIGTTTFRIDPRHGKVMRLTKADDTTDRYGRKTAINGLSGSVYTHSVYVRALSTTGRIACMSVDAAKTGGGLIVSSRYFNLSDLPLGEWVRVHLTKDGSPDTLEGGGAAYVWVDADKGDCEFALPMLEVGSFATSPCEGARSHGFLPYDPKIVYGMSEIAILIKAKRPAHLYSISYLFSATIDPLQSPYANTFAIRSTASFNGLYFWTVDPLGENSEQVGTSDLWTDDKEHNIVVYMNHNPAPGRHKKELYFDGELIGYSDPAALPDLSQITYLNVGTWANKSAWWGSPIKMFCIKPTCTPEQVKAWHSLDAPFIDPYVALSQDIPYSNTVDEFKNSTANFAMVNVEGIVKLYARTPEGIIIIETLGNTEVI